MCARLSATAVASGLIGLLRVRHGNLTLRLFDERCEDLGPACERTSAFELEPDDVLLGNLEGARIILPAAQFVCRRHGHIIVDAVLARSSRGVPSLEVSTGLRFIVRMRPFTHAEHSEVARLGPIARAKLQPWGYQ